MKRFSKIFSGIAAIMLGVGIILIAFGLGSARADWDKIMGAWQGSGQTIQEFDNVKSIEIDVPFGFLDVAATEGDKVYFVAANVNPEALKVQQKGTKLEIHVDGWKNNMLGISAFAFLSQLWGSGDRESTMQGYQLLLPEDYMGQLEIDLEAGKVWVHGVAADKMEISVDMGELLVEECSAKKIDASCDIGQCTVKGSFTEISAGVDMGALNALIYGSAEDYNGVIACEMGKMEYHMGPDSGSEYIDYGDGILRQGAWARRSGIDLRKKWESPTAKGELKIKCDIGDVAVTFVEGDLAVPDTSVDMIQLQELDTTSQVPSEDMQENSARLQQEESVIEAVQDDTDGSVWQDSEMDAGRKEKGDKK